MVITNVIVNVNAKERSAFAIAIVLLRSATVPVMESHASANVIVRMGSANALAFMMERSVLAHLSARITVATASVAVARKSET